MNDYCRDKAAPEGSNLYYACLYQAPAIRQRLCALFALYYELQEGVLSASDPGVSRIKLEWWRDELARLERGEARHPVTQALQPLLEQGEITLGPLSALPPAMESLLSMPATETDGWHQVGAIGDFWQCAAAASGPVTDAERDLAAATGSAVARLELLQNLRHLLALGFNPLPRQTLAETGLSGEELMGDPVSEKSRTLASALVTTVHNDLEACYRSGKRPGRHLLFVLIMNRIAAATCWEIARDGHRILSRKLALTPIRKLWIAWRTRYARLLP